MQQTLKKEKGQPWTNQESKVRRPVVSEERHTVLKTKVELLLEQTGFRRRNILLGLDIGSSGIKLAEVERIKRGWRLVNAGIFEFDSSFGEMSGPEAEGELVLNIRTAIKRFDVRTKKVALSISGDDLIQRLMNVPSMPKRELMQVLGWEVKKYTDLPSEQFNIDFLERPRESGSKDNSDVFFVSIPVRRVNQSISMTQAAGLSCAILETEATALAGAVIELMPELRQTTIAILDIGSKTSLMNIISRGFLSFTREIEWGGDNLTMALHDRLGYGSERAEAQKKEVGLPGSTRENEAESGEERLNVAHTLEQEVDNLSVEIANSLEYYRANFPQDEIGQLLLTGGSSGLPGLQSFLTQRLGMTIEPFDPLNSLLLVQDAQARRYVQELSCRLSVALGLATRRK